VLDVLLLTLLNPVTRPLAFTIRNKRSRRGAGCAW